MSTMRNFVAVCATVLLAAGMSRQFADAEGCLSGIKCLFSGQKGYATLANYLYKATQSDKLVDNTKAAGALLSEHPNSKEDVKQLAQAFSSLKGYSRNPWDFCTKDNLANLRVMAEGMRDGGNLGPKKITDGVRRLNKIVIKVIEDAHKICSRYLTEEWPGWWQPNFSDPAMSNLVASVYNMAKSFTYEGFVSPSDDSRFIPNWRGYTISSHIRLGEQKAAHPIDPNEPDLLKTENKIVLAKQLEEYIYKPCSEFVRMNEATEVLVPFNDMLKSWFLVTYDYLNEYYKNDDSCKPTVSYDSFDAAVRRRAISYQACQRLLATPKEDLVNIVRDYRIEDRRSQATAA